MKALLSKRQKSYFIDALQAYVKTLVTTWKGKKKNMRIISMTGVKVLTKAMMSGAKRTVNFKVWLNNSLL